MALAPPAKHDAKKATAASATVAKPVKEEQLNTITLSPEAVARLALKTGLIERRPMPQSRFYGGEVVIPAGRTAIVSAPISGVLRAAPEGLPAPGQTIDQGRVVFELLPLLTPEGRANLIALQERCRDSRTDYANANAGGANRPGPSQTRPRR